MPSKMRKVENFSDIQRFPYPQGNTDFILLYLDNSQITHNKCLKIISETQSRSESERVKAIRRYITGSASGDLLSVGDREQARLLSREINDMKKCCSKEQQIVYWKSVWDYFASK